MSSNDKKATGRPTDYTPELVDRMLERISSGQSVNSICKEDAMPAKATFFRWLREYPEFKDNYEIAARERSESYIEDITEIADNGTNDWMETNDPDNPGYKYNGEHVQRSRLRVDARKWVASKLKPKKYGERLETVNKHTHDLNSMTDEELSRRVRELERELENSKRGQ